MNQKAFLKPLQGLRGYAALWVVLFHIFMQSIFAAPSREVVPGFILNFFQMGFIAVDLFFVLSGFIMCYVYDDLLKEFDFSKIKHFLILRLGRIYPVHIVAEVLYGIIALILVFVVGKSIDPQKYSLTCYFESVVLIQSWGWQSSNCWNGVAWTISLEWMAYLAFPFFAPFFLRMRRPMLAIFWAIACQVLLIGVLISLGHESPLISYGPGAVMHMIGGFLSGCFVFVAFRHWKFSKLPWPAIGAGSAFFIFLFSALVKPYALFVFFPPLVFALATNRGIISKALSTPSSMFLGDISYSLYITHYMVMDAYLRLMKYRGITEMSSEDIFTASIHIIVLIVLMFIFAIIMHIKIEVPARQWFRRLS